MTDGSRKTGPFRGWTVLASLAVHAVVLGTFGFVAFYKCHQMAPPPGSHPPADEATIPIDLPVVAEGTARADGVVDRTGEKPVVSGGATVARLDTGRAGRGGDATSVAQATHLSDRDEYLHLTTDEVSHLDRDQIQRIRSATSRASWEDRRLTTHPMELTFIVTGHGIRQERRPVSPSDPSRGALRSGEASALGGRPGAMREESGDEDTRRDPGAAREGALVGSPGVGVHGVRAGEDHRRSAASTRARPDVTLGRVSIPATDHALPRDDVDSSQDVATALRSLVQGSYAGGARGPGGGGTGGGGDPGAGGASGAGSHPPPLGLSDGTLYDLETSDPRLLPYFRKIHAKIQPLWAHAFPKSAILELKQGTVILEFTIARDGTATVSWPPLRPSGVEEFDRNCADAIRRASPFDPIPAVLGVSRLRVRAPFVASNPVVK